MFLRSLTFLMSLATTCVLAQHDTIYFDSHRFPLETNSGASFFMVVAVMNSNLIEAREYKTDGTHIRSLSFNDPALFTKHGELIVYYSNGQKKIRGMYHEGQPAGTFTEWYSNGQLKATKHFEKNQWVIQDFYDSLGKVMVKEGEGEYVEEGEDASGVPTQEFTDAPRLFLKGPVKSGIKHGVYTGYLADGTVFCQEEYKNGKFVKGKSFIDGREVKYSSIMDEKAMTKIMSHIAKNIRYPAVARRYGLQGTVYHRLLLNPDGTVRKAIPLKGVHPELDAEAWRVLTETNMKFGPMVMRGQKVTPVNLIFPLKFKLN